MSATQDGLTGFYLILPTARISVTRQTAALFHAPVATFTQEELNYVHTQYYHWTNEFVAKVPHKEKLSRVIFPKVPIKNYTADFDPRVTYIFTIS